MINFRFSNKVLQNEVSDAVLNIHIQELESRQNISLSGPEEGHFTVNIQVSRVTTTGNAKAAMAFTDNSVKMSSEEVRRGKWLKINVTRMVAEFFRLPRDNLAVIVRVQDSRSRMSLVVPHPSSQSNHALVSCFLF